MGWGGVGWGGLVVPLDAATAFVVAAESAADAVSSSSSSHAAAQPRAWKAISMMFFSARFILTTKLDKVKFQRTSGSDTSEQWSSRLLIEMCGGPMHCW